MAEIYPFRGIRYDQETVKGLANVICPPYDVITPQQQELYYKKSDYNAIRLECAMERLSANTIDNKYTRVASTFQQWLKEGILRGDDRPTFYLHDHYFTYLGRERRRRGLMARVRLKPWYGGVYPHEETFSKAKQDRLELMRSCQANFSSILVLYQDLGGSIARILSGVSQGKPVIELSDSGERHTVWSITESKLVHQVNELFINQPIYVADGHHRYETALAYQHERAHPSPDEGRRESSAPLTNREAFNYVMMTLVDLSDTGLLVLPIHRLVRGITHSTLSGLKGQLSQFFSLKSVPLTENLVGTFKGKMIGEAPLGILGLETGSLILLKQRQGVSTEDAMPRGHSQAYNNLNVSLLTHLILDRMLGIAQDSEDIAYTIDVAEAYQRIREGKYQLAFLLSPLQPEMVKTIADARDRMPRKSTYFYPKLPTGLVINPLG